MSSFRCTKCHQLQFKYQIRGNKLIIETKCYGCNHFTYLTIWLNKLTNIQKYEKSNEYKKT